MLRLVKVMRVLGVLGMLFVLPAQAADAPAKAMEELTTNVAKDTGSAAPYACPVGATPGAKAAAPGGSAAYNLKALTTKWRVSKKNLPAGNYRERCFACLMMPDEDGERQLSCVCPVKQGVERIAVSLLNYTEGQEISYCYGVLVRGACMLTENVAAEKAKTSNSANDATTTNFLNMIAREKGK